MGLPGFIFAAALPGASACVTGIIDGFLSYPRIGGAERLVSLKRELRGEALEVQEDHENSSSSFTGVIHNLPYYVLPVISARYVFAGVYR